MHKYEWVRHLPPDALNEFVNELVDEVAEDRDIEPLLAAWRATAEVYANAELFTALTTPSEGDFGPVPAPVLYGAAEIEERPDLNVPRLTGEQLDADEERR